MQKHKVIIVGGGLGGLFAARTLADAGVKDFKILTKEITERTPCSENGAVNYGTYFVTKQYKHLMQYVKKTRKISLWKVGFVNNGKPVSLYNWRMIVALPELLHFSIIALRFIYHFHRYRRRCEHMSQKKALEADPYLLKLYHTNTGEYLDRKRINRLAKWYMEHTINIIGFDHPRKSNAFSFLKWMAEIYLYSMYEFELQTDKLTKGYEQNIVQTTVTDIAKTSEGHYRISTDDQEYEAEYVVVATPAWVTFDLLKIPTKEPFHAKAFVTQIRGTPKGIAACSKRYIVFPVADEIISITKASDGTYLIYTQSPDVSIDAYFNDIEVLYEKYWDPAFPFCSFELVESEYDTNLYVGSDVNFAGGENAALTGVFAGRQILEKLQKAT